MFGLTDLLLEIGKGRRTSVVSNSGLVTAANFQSTTNIGSLPEPSVLLDIDVVLSDAQLKLGGTFPLIPAAVGRLISLVSFQGYLRIDTGGGTNITATAVRYVGTSINVMAGFSLLSGVAANGHTRYTSVGLSTINTQTSLDLGSLGLEMTTTGTAHADFASFSGGYHCVMTYLSILQQ